MTKNVDIVDIVLNSLLRHFCHSQHCHTIRHSLYQALLLLDVWFEAEVDALALSPDAAGGTGALPADAVLAIIDGAALLVEGAEAVGRVKGVPCSEELKSFDTRSMVYKEHPFKKQLVISVQFY